MFVIRTSRLSLVAPVLALALALGACSRQGDPARDYNASSNPSVPPSTGMAPSTPASPAPGAAPAATPETHAGTPQPGVPAGPTARDSQANRPQGDLTKQEESNAMPKAGQVNNYNSPAYEPKKGAGGNQ